VNFVAGVPQQLFFAMLTAALGTAVFYATGIDWSFAHETRTLGPAALAFLMALSFALLPYALLVALLRRTQSSPLFQIASFALFLALPVVAFASWRLNGINTAGWDFLLVPVWQVALLAVLYALSFLVVRRNPGALGGS